MRPDLPLVTERLMLREFVRGDAEWIHCYTSDASVVQYLDIGPESESETRQFVADAIDARWQEPRHDFDLAVMLTESGRLIGHLNLHVTQWRHREAEIGYCLHRQFWGKGYATEAVQALLQFGFGQLQLHRQFALCDTNNRSSVRVMVKAGMQPEGYLHQHKWYRGAWHDSLLYAIWKDSNGRQV